MIRTLSVLLFLVGCDNTSDELAGFDASPATNHRAWGTSDDPSILGDDFEYTFANLPAKGEAKNAPWAGNYWPTYRDNLNYRWEGKDNLSPAGKFAAAFERDDLEDRVSAEFGIESISTAKTCTEDKDCLTANSEVCARRFGEDEGKCIETWFGICHAWAPAAIMEPEPMSSVTHNGVEFKVNDIKALVSLQYTEGLDVKFMSLRCDDKGKGEGAMEYDEYGNPKPADCADTNAGSFHIAVTNLLGIQGVSFVEDRTFDYEVWNQPVRSYEVTHSAVVTATKANSLAGVTDGSSDYEFNDDADSFRHIKLSLRYITESAQTLDGNLADTLDTYTRTDRYEYVLELDADGKVIGGEWVGDSKTRHPDFLWLPTVKKETELAAEGSKSGTGIKWSEVKDLLNQSVGETSGFNWGSACDDGSGSFSQAIARDATATIGTIPTGKNNVRIDLKSDADVDVQLVDVDSGTEIIAWPNGLMSGADKSCTTHKSVEYCYSGYNGDGKNLGHEWIEINGVTNRAVEMRAFGYASGDAVVSYSFEATDDCVDSGSGSFSQAIAHQSVVDVGVIPSGKADISIELKSSVDVDIQLFDGSTALVQWPDGKLNGAGEQTLTYGDLTIVWSGYNGDGTNPGNETITISGTLSSDLTMKAFGYAAGDAEVSYAWGVDL